MAHAINIRKILAGFILMAVIAMIGEIALAQPAQADTYSDEAAFYNLLNHERGANGLAPLAWDPALVHNARAQSERMAASLTIFHNANLAGDFAGGGWTALGENVGVGMDVGGLHHALVFSPSHRANILGDFDRVGMGVVHANGMIYLTQVFMKTGGSSEVGAGDSGGGTATVRSCKKVKGRKVCKSVKKKKISKKKRRR
ncbi:MAG TPA: CAP domain-containing protein [Actinomycetota bacterium]|nr:CAP domain-containing protein [Actinomycetota bacterium]